MEVLEFTARQTVTWFQNNKEMGEITYNRGDKLHCEILCKEESSTLPKHQFDPIYYYTVRNLRGYTGVILAFINHPIHVRALDEEPTKAA
jgi:hypothetical protein